MIQRSAEISILKEIFLDSSQSVNSFVQLRSSLSVADRLILSGSPVTIRIRLGSVLSPRGSTMIGGDASVDDDLQFFLVGLFEDFSAQFPPFSTFIVPRQNVAVPMVVGKMGREHLSLEDKMEISKDGKFPRPLPAGYELLV
jgi:hypothetical protein